MEYGFIYYAVVLSGVLTLTLGIMKLIERLDTPSANRRLPAR